MEKRLQTILQQAGIASRRASADLIERGKVKIDGRTVREKGVRVDPEKASVEINGRVIRGLSEKKCYYLLNKPRDVVSTAVDTHGRAKVTDLIKTKSTRLYPVGRLDKNTTGLIIITNDGELTYRLSHPSFCVDKEYVVEVRDKVSSGDIRKLADGVEVEGRMTSPCKVVSVKKTLDKTTLKITIHEGRKRQIRKMFESLGYKVTALDRVKYAGLTLGKLKRGEYRELTDKELERLKNM